MMIVRLATTLCVRKGLEGGTGDERARPACLAFHVSLDMGAKV